MKTGNTPDRIVTRDTGAIFYCANCKQRYQKCRCKVYLSADAAFGYHTTTGERKRPNKPVSGAGKGILGIDLDAIRGQSNE